MEKLTREEALRLHRQMWSDMRKEFGDRPYDFERSYFKREWCLDHGYDGIEEHCFLCEYAEQNKIPCDKCIIDWGGSNCTDYDISYWSSPISEILALPERKENEKSEKED